MDAVAACFASTSLPQPRILNSVALEVPMKGLTNPGMKVCMQQGRFEENGHPRQDPRTNAIKQSTYKLTCARLTDLLCHTSMWLRILPLSFCTSSFVVACTNILRIRKHPAPPGFCRGCADV